MDLDKMTMVVRPRTQWEAVDLGFLMVRAFWPILYGAWIVVALPIAIAVSIFFYNNILVAILIIWWLKPLYERLPLYILSHILFGETLKFSQILRQAPKLLLPHLFQSLILYRFSPYRSFTSPVWQLENLRGKTHSHRIRILKRNAAQSAMALTYIFYLTEGILFFSLLNLLYFFFPQMPVYDENSIGLFNALIGKQNILLNMIHVFFIFTAMTIIGPFYTAAGFTIYLNRRTILEAWDIELIFRKLVNRITHRNGSKKLALLWVTCALLSLTPPPTSAQEISTWHSRQDYTDQHEQSQKNISEVLLEPEFNNYSNHTPREWHLPDFSWGQSFSSGGGPILEFLMWVFISVLVLILFYYFMKHFKPRKIPKPTKKSAFHPVNTLTLSQQPESWPADIPSAVIQLCQKQQWRQALSLLYTATLFQLTQQFSLTLNESATEGEWLVAVNQLNRNELISFFTQLTRLWINTAYAHELPNPGIIEHLCQQWRLLFK